MSITDLMEKVSKKLYKLGQVITKVTDNLETIEKYCEKNLKQSHSLSSLYTELKKSIYASCNQIKKPASVYTNVLIPLCKKAVTDFDNIYDVRFTKSDAEAKKRDGQVEPCSREQDFSCPQQIRRKFHGWVSQQRIEACQKCDSIGKLELQNIQGICRHVWCMWK